MTDVTRQRYTILDAAVAVVLIAGLVAFWQSEVILVVHVGMLAVVAAAAILAVTGRDRVLLALAEFYLAITTLLALFLNQVLPVWILFPLVWIIAGLLIFWLIERAPHLEQQEGVPLWLFGLAGGTLAVEALWFLSPWPFDPKSKGAVLTLFFYLLWLVLRDIRTSQKRSIGQWAAVGVWLFGILAVLLWFAQWQVGV